MSISETFAVLLLAGFAAIGLAMLVGLVVLVRDTVRDPVRSR